MTYKFEVIGSDASKNGGFINRLQTETTMKVLGVAKTTKHIYHLKTEESVEVGSIHELDLANFEVKTYKGSEYVDKTTGEVRQGSDNKWLHERLAQ